ncbi:Similar to conserved hypothetical protein [Ajellomyces capsulatus G186AR]; acc. no. EEH05913 [Pyronema omphalodes CBS 100304]|uniref:Uncharacterized protein n=1 Tax=Pyronema omphalodes (strain CBS 100304) TaxID=1076935 RepID=U4LP48_PYROM|nr:Similar to conserved hypothetical protein [Ajellomyces capsulatus G186AR]; acc. no. EEH05913 [Pyronema omphalodes CBS 100304]
MAKGKKDAAALTIPVSIPAVPKEKSKAAPSHDTSETTPAKKKAKAEPIKPSDPKPKDGIQAEDVKVKKSKTKAPSDSTEVQKKVVPSTALSTKKETGKKVDELPTDSSTKKKKNKMVPLPVQDNKEVKASPNAIVDSKNEEVSSTKTPIEKKPKEAQAAQAEKNQNTTKSENKRPAKTETGLLPGFFKHPLSIPVTYIQETPALPANPPSINDTGLSIDQRFFCTSLLRRTVSHFGSGPHRPYVNPDEYSPGELLDRFLDSIASIFDTGPSGKTVTASALRDDNGPILLLASNTTIKQETFTHAQQILESLKRFNFGSDVEENLESDITRILVTIGAQRLKVSQNALRILVADLINGNAAKKLDEVSMGTLRNLLHIASDPDPNYVCRACHDIITHGGMKHLQQTHETTFSNNKSISQIRHFMVLLASFFSVTKILIRTLRIHRELFKNIRVEIVPSPPRTLIPGPLNPEICQSVDTVVPVVFRVDQGRSRCLELLKRQDVDIIHRRLDRDLSEAETIVHAETTLVNYFRRENHRFYFPANRYIGCSKDACYLCQLYFSSLRGLKIELRGCHKELFLTWRTPQHRKNSDREAVLNRMMEFMRWEILEILEKTDGKGETDEN